jgi:hypothetical protein
VWIDRWKVVRRAVLVWACWLITETVFYYLDHMGQVNGYDVAVITAITGILGAVIRFQATGPGD